MAGVLGEAGSRLWARVPARARVVRVWNFMAVEESTVYEKDHRKERRKDYHSNLLSVLENGVR